MSRDSFLDRVRAAAASGRLHRVHVREDIPASAGYCGAGPDPVARLAEEVAAAGGMADIVDDFAAARLKLAALVEQYGAKSALCWRHPTLDHLGLAELLASRGVHCVDYSSLASLEPQEQRVHILAADIGISSVDFAIAESGTLAVASAPGRERVTSLVPPVHVAIVESSQILPDLFDLFARLQEADLDKLATNLVLITGPSKTGDLELRLTTGVHGPGKVYVIVVR